MRDQGDKIDRRTLFKLMGAAGASATVVSAGGLGAAEALASGVIQTGVDAFEIRVGDDELEELSTRLAMTRWARDVGGAPWAYGTDREFLEELVAYWKDRYDWRVHETELNAFNHYTTTIEGQLVHFIRQEGRGGSALPLVMTHGWPGTIWEMLPSVRALSDPASYGGDAADSFDVVAPSIPGFGFSGEPAEGPEQCVDRIQGQFDLGCDGVILHGASPVELEPIVGAWRKHRSSDSFRHLAPNPAG